MASQVQENYLKALYHLSYGGKPMTVSNLSSMMGVSKPTVNNMIKLLEGRGWVDYEKYRPLKLTEEGKIKAAHIIRKHRLTEMFLHKILGFGWDEVHEIAEQMEHIDSPRLFERIDEILDYPEVDPHGSLIPDSSGQLPDREARVLSAVEPGERVTIIALNGSHKALLKFLDEHHIQLGTEVVVISKIEFDNSCVIRYNDVESLTLTEQVSQSLLVN